MDSSSNITILAKHTPGKPGFDYTLVDWGESSHQILKEIFYNIGRGKEYPFRLEFQFDEIGKEYLEINRSINHHERELDFQNGLLILLHAKILHHYIKTLNDYEKVISGFLQEWRCTDNINLHQFDLWKGSNENPAFVAKAYLTSKEIDSLKKSTGNKLFTRHQYSLSDLPKEILLKKIIPSILLRMSYVYEKVTPQMIEELLDLSSWKLGVG